MRRETAIDNFFRAYKELKKYKEVRLHTCVTIHTALKYETLIEIDRYAGGERKERILKVTQEDEIEAYEQATDYINEMLRQIKAERNEA